MADSPNPAEPQSRPGMLASDLPTQMLDPSRDPTAAGGAVSSSLQPGQSFGPYRIVRLLGRGGMGEVHEAEHRESGRRVALKILNATLGPDDRARFLREGRLAALLSHPNTVYIYGTEEIAGVLVISMELAPGGTLKERVQAHGPLPPKVAVDLTLQMIAGLDAAARAGVLHRDVKPSNCFLDRDGGVKVGDFGLSISTMARDETQLTMAGTLLGTPAFASPEQLRGEALDVRSDIYSVGATLFYLLTGRAPFEEPNLVKLVGHVLQDTPPSPHALRSDVPRGLAQATLRALAKRPGDRIQTYAELAEALECYGSEAPVPAGLGPRFLAGIVDTLVANVPAAVPIAFKLIINGSFQSRVAASWSWMGAVTLLMLYYGVLESKWGASVGKRLLRLRVVGAAGQAADPVAVLRRTLTFLGVVHVPQLMVILIVGPKFFLEPREGLSALGPSLLSPAVLWASLMLLFGRARASNGFAALHDRVSSTRVIVRSPAAVGREAAGPPAERVLAGGQAVLGPYRVAAEGGQDPGDVIVGFDEVLNRRVWIRKAAPGEPAIPAARRDLDRPHRLRWLAGRREPAGGWDAFEAPDGALLTNLRSPAAVADVVRCVSQLAAEIGAGQHASDLPPLSLTRVWITGQGDVKLLDWPAPGETAGGDVDSAGATRVDAWDTFLHLVMMRRLQGASGAQAGRKGSPRDAVPPPLYMTTVARRLAQHGFTDPAAVVDELRSLAIRPLTVSRSRRLVQLVTMGATPGFVLASFLGVMLLAGWMARQHPDLPLLVGAAEELRKVDRDPPTAATADRRRALEILVSGRLRTTLENPAFKSSGLQAALLPPPRSQRLQQAIAARPTVSADEVRAAEHELATFLSESQRGNPLTGRVPATVFLLMATFIWIPNAAVGIVSAVLLRGGVTFRAFGIGVVDARGDEVSRMRALARSAIGWAPMLVPALFLLGFGGQLRQWEATFNLLAVVFMSVFLLGAIVAVLRPARGLQDRLAGTYLVPR